MKTITKEFYICEICNEEYKSKAEAMMCEGKPVSEDKGVKIGDIVLVTTGQAAGQRGKVGRIFIYDKNWGHYNWKRYWHTVGLEAEMFESWGSRQLTFDDYEVSA